MWLTLLVRLLIISPRTHGDEQECLKVSSTECCADFYFEDGSCKPCKSGYFGPNCGKTCPYPLYGRKCVDGICKCPPHQCDVAAGCLVDVSETNTRTMTIRTQSQNETRFTRGVNRSTIQLSTERTAPPPKTTSILLDKMREKSTASSFQLILIISSVLQRSEQECLPHSSTKCCADFYFDAGTCKPCKIGYFGPNCWKTCPYPKYGRKCVDGECNCSPTHCHFADGCLQQEIRHIRNLSLNGHENTTEEGRSDDSFVEKSSDLKIPYLLVFIIVALVTSAVVSVVVIVITVCSHHSGQSTRRHHTERKTSSTDG